MNNDPYTTPRASLEVNSEDYEYNYKYVGFWPRFGAFLIDALLLVAITWPLSYLIYGWEFLTSEQFIVGFADFILTYIVPAMAVILFWVRYLATPGKMAIKAKIVDAKSGGPPTIGQFIGRYLAYNISLLPVGLGYLWIAWDSRKQGWHDKLAGTVVVRPITRNN
jgi:uncharacterized RDD family membrane protein YckC